jgi:hypothetical protein
MNTNKQSTPIEISFFILPLGAASELRFGASTELPHLAAASDRLETMRDQKTETLATRNI